MNRLIAILCTAGTLVFAGCSSSDTTATGTMIGFRITSSQVDAIVVGSPVTLTVAAIDASGSVVTAYQGTAQLASDDTAATVDLVFGAADGGSKNTQFATDVAGTITVSVKDKTNANLTGLISLHTKNGAATKLQIKGLASSASAGDALPFAVTALDAKGNAVKDYTGQVTVTSDDAAAVLPAAYTYVSADSGSHTFGVALATSGTRTVTVSDGTLGDHASVTVSHGSAAQFVIDQLASEAIAGASQGFRVTARDRFGNLVTNHAGPVTLGSTDPAASFGAPGAFSGGQASMSVTFATIGAQTVLVSDPSAGFSAEGGPVAVHGLVYTPPATSGRMLQIVADSSSTAALLVLKVVAAGTTSGYSAGFNIPADATRARVVDVAWGGGPLNPGSSPSAIAAALPGTGPLHDTLTSGISQKAGGSGAVAGDSAIVANNVLYSVRLAPTSASPGVVFDGADRFRAALRDHEGNEVLSQADFAVGKLEIQ